MRQWPLNITICTASVLIGLVLAEGATRLIHPFSTVEYRVDPEVGQILVANQRSRWVNEDYDETVFINSAGFHDVDHETEKPANVYRIVVIGDSFIEALSAPIEAGFTQQLQHLLQKEMPHRSVEVINLGVSGTGPAQYYRMLDMKGLAYHPDLVIMSVFPDNDFWDSYEQLSGGPSKVFYRLQADNSLEYLPALGSTGTSNMLTWYRKSAILMLLRTGLSASVVGPWLGKLGVLKAPGVANQGAIQWEEWGVYLADQPDPWPNAFSTTLQIIKSSHELSLKAGTQFAVMLIGSTAMVEDRWDEAFRDYSEATSMQWDFDRPFKAIMALGKDKGFHVINLVEPFREDFITTKQSRSWPHDGHWNHAGNNLAAQVVSRYIESHRQEYILPD